MDTDNATKSIYFIKDPNPTAEAIVIEIDNSLAKLLLVGIDSGLVTNGTIFVDHKNRGIVQIIQRNGLIATGKMDVCYEPAITLSVASR